jgi:nuclear cap-binding protein subunit 1
MLALLEAFTAVLEEFGVSHTRAKRAALCAFDGLMTVSSGMSHLRLEVAESVARLVKH